MARYTLEKDHTDSNGTRTREWRVHDDTKFLPSSKPSHQIIEKANGDIIERTYDEKSLWNKWR